MMNNKNTKLIVILSLIVAIVGLTIGFAAFSNQLKISSSASVTPDASDFKITIYGRENDTCDSYGDLLDECYTSKNISMPSTETQDSLTSTTANIDNNNFTISNISANLRDGEDAVLYSFMIKNEGKYDAYLDLTNMEEFRNSDFASIIYNFLPTGCTSGDNANATLAEKTCREIVQDIYLYDSKGSQIQYATDVINNKYLLEKGEHIYLYLEIYPLGVFTKPDADLTATFQDITLTFSTAP